MFRPPLACDDGTRFRGDPRLSLVRPIPCMLAAALAGCSSACPNPITQVELEPAEHYLAEGSSFRATARGFARARLDRLVATSLDRPCVFVRWSASEGVSVEPGGADAEIALLDVREGVVTATVTVRRRVIWCLDEVSRAEGRLSVKAPNFGDMIVEGDPPDGALTAVLVRAHDGKGPRWDWAFGVSGTAALGTNLEPLPNGTSEVAAFRTGRSALLRGDGQVGPWTSAPDVVQVDSGPGFLRTIPVWFVFPSGAFNPSKDSDWAEGQVRHVTDLFEANRVGIGLEFRGAFSFPDTLDVVTDTTAACDHVNAYLQGYPGQATGIAQTSNAALVTGSADIIGEFADLFVILVSALPEDRRGRACPDTASAGRTVFVSKRGRGAVTLPHEVIHHLGFLSEMIDVDGVDFSVPGFEFNLMYAHQSDDWAALRDHLTLGQVYRMNFDEDSWINRIYAGSGHPTRDCQPRVGDTIPCPALFTDLGG